METSTEINAIKDIEVRRVDNIPGWPEGVHIKTLTGNDLDRWEQAMIGARNAKIPAPFNMRGLLLSMAICDAAGKRLYTDADAALIGSRSARAINYIYEAIEEMNYLGRKGVEDAEKN